MNEILLTIAIPTYNRSDFLKRNLESIWTQRETFLGKVEIIVSDNASIDDTQEIVESYKNNGLDIKYIKNAKNMGPDFNITQCYTVASGKYVLTLGDDDFFIENSIGAVINLLGNGNYGVVFLNSEPHIANPITYTKNNFKLDKLKYTVFSNPMSFLRKVNYFVTFISGNIINKEYFDKEDFLKNEGSMLIQVSFIVNTIMRSPQNVYIEDKLLLVEPDNTGGYNLFKVFGQNFIKIISELKYANQNEIKLIKSIIFNNLLVKFFPIYILKQKENQNNSFINTNVQLQLKPYFKGYFNYWLCCYPLCFLPNKIAGFYAYLIKAYSKMRSLLIDLVY